MVYDLPFSHVKELGAIFNIMDSQKVANLKMGGQKSGKKTKMSKEEAMDEIKTLVTDVAVSQTTLEEVFMHVTEANQRVNDSDKKTQ